MRNRTRLGLAVALSLAVHPGAASVAAPFDVLDAVDGIDGARAVAASPDGAHVYVCAALANAIAAFAVDPGTGALTPAGTVVDGVGGVDGLAGCVDVAVSPDGAHVYAAGFGDDAIAIFTRDAGTGALTFADSFLDAELPASALVGASGVAVSPDGEHVYATAGVSDALVAFARDAQTGLLAFVEAETGEPLLDGAVDLAISPDGTRLYALAQGVTNQVPADALLTYARDGASGQLTLVDSERDGVAGVQGLTFPNALTVAPNGAHVYTVAGFAGSQGSILGRLAVFVRSPADASTSYLGLWADDANGVDGLGYAIGITTTADGRWVLATGAADDALAVFRRDALTGLLTFDRVVRDDASRLLDGAIDVAADPLGRFLYVAAISEDSLTVLAPEPGRAASAAALAAVLMMLAARLRLAARESGPVTSPLASGSLRGKRDGRVSRWIGGG